MAYHRPPLTDAMPILMVAFAGGNEGAWRVRSVSAVIGTPLPTVQHLEIFEGAWTDPASATWILRGVVGHERYVGRREHDELVARSPRLGRPEATRAALIPIRKSEAWWTLPHDERRAIFEERSRHMATGLEYLPAVARRLHHSRDLGEPFDFLTWFEFAPSDEARFDELVAMLRATEEWAFIDREVDIRLER
jgi:chlorite dismutase